MEPAGPTQAVFSSSEVAAHNRADDCWLVISGAVYDVTRFLREHPGGVMLLLAYAGADATMPFVETGHSRLALQQLETLRIGVLADGPADQAYNNAHGIMLKQWKPTARPTHGIMLKHWTPC